MQVKIGRITAWVAGIGIAVAATGASAATLIVHESRMPDGSVVVGDKAAPGAKSVRTHRYDYTPADRSQVAAEREYWRQESQAFAQRHQAREYATRRGGYPAAGASYDSGYPGGYVGYYPGAGRPLVPHSLVQPSYTTSPGAVNGRGPGFIGSGFSTAR